RTLQVKGRAWTAFESWGRAEADLPPGDHWLRLSRDVRDCTVDAIRHLLTPAEGAPVPLGPRRDSPRLTPCQRDVVELLRRADRRMTTSVILASLSEANLRHGESTVKLALRDLKRPPLELLDNRQDTEPRGYGLREWQERA